MPTKDEILRHALDLPENERARVAIALLESLDGPRDDDAEQAWAVEVATRLREIESGAAKTVPASEAFARVRLRPTPECESTKRPASS